MNILVIASSYPTSLTPTKHVFLQKLIWTFADKGHSCTVVSPVDYRNRKLSNLPLQSVEYTNNNNKVNLYFPRYLGFGFTKKMSLNVQNISMANYSRSVHRILKTLSPKVDLVYSHFLSPAGICASRIGKKMGIKSYVAFGESNMWSIEGYGVVKIKEELSGISGFISVSTENKKRLIDLGITENENIQVFPNGVDLSVFKKYDKDYCREKLGIEKEQFVVAFVGQFTERKGVMRVAEALNNLEGVGVAFAGKGELEPDIDNCIFKGIVRPEEMPIFLNAADVFVLPTLNEGCCNAIIEAMACGLPIISSNLPFNDDILNEHNSIRINPENISEIRQSVLNLKENKHLQMELSQASLEAATNLSLDNRASRILQWMKNMN